VIHKGRLLYDGELTALTDRIAPFKLVRLDFETAEAGAQAEKYGDLVERQENKVTLRLPRAETSVMVARMLSELPVLDLTVEDPPIEAVIEQVFQEARVVEGAEGDPEKQR
jgi:ABC-2 type transport system ATP-binding protein